MNFRFSRVGPIRSAMSLGRDSFEKSHSGLWCDDLAGRTFRLNRVLEREFPSERDYHSVIILESRRLTFYRFI